MKIAWLQPSCHQMFTALRPLLLISKPPTVEANKAGFCANKAGFVDTKLTLGVTDVNVTERVYLIIFWF